MAHRGSYLPPEGKKYSLLYFNVTAEYIELLQQLHSQISGDIFIFSLCQHTEVRRVTEPQHILWTPSLCF